MAVPYTFGSATTSIPLSQLDSNFATTITLGNTAVQLGNTVTTLNNMTLANVTVSSGNATVTNANVTTLTATNDASISSLTVGKGGGAVSSNTAIGVSSLQANTTASNNTAVGYQAGYTQTTADRNAILGTQAGYAGTTGFANAYVGYQTGYANTTGYLSAALGAYALASCSTGVQNTAIGAYALNVATGSNNVAVGKDAGVAVTTGTLNTLIGLGAGYVVTTGSKNTILGGFSGNQGGLDIRTASNYIVLSDGDGNPRLSIPTGTATATVPNATGTVMVSGNMPAFRATSTSIGSQTFASSTSTKVQFNSKIFDTNNYFDATTNYRFTPLISGYYQINATISLASAIGVISAQLYKNGSAYSSPQFPLNSGYTSGSVSDIVFLNGSTDYLEIYGYQNSGSTLTLVPNNLLVNFSGAMVRVA